MTIYEFADVIQVDLEIIIYANQQGRHMAHFRNAAIKDGAFLSYNHGNGTDTRSALSNYINQIKGQLLVVNPNTDYRKEFRVPESLTV